MQSMMNNFELKMNLSLKYNKIQYQYELGPLSIIGIALILWIFGDIPTLILKTLTIAGTLLAFVLATVHIYRTIATPETKTSAWPTIYDPKALMKYLQMKKF